VLLPSSACAGLLAGWLALEQATTNKAAELPEVVDLLLDERKKDIIAQP
jgi:hypothetical protein